MKKIALLFVLVLGITFFADAQSPRHIVKFSTHIEGTDDVNITSQEILDEECMFLENKYKMAISTSDMTQSVIIDGDKKTFTLVLENPMEGYYLEMSFVDIVKDKSNIEFKYDYTDETKTIAGVVCKKVNVTMIDNETDEEKKIVLYVTEELPSVFNEINYIGLKGYPLREEVPSVELGEGVIIVKEAVEFTPSKKIKEINFMLASGLKNMRDYPDIMNAIGLGDEDE